MSSNRFNRKAALTIQREITFTTNDVIQKIIL